MTQEEYCRIRLFDPMGISEEAYWHTDPRGIADGGNRTCHHLPGCCQIRAALSERRHMEWAAAGSRRLGGGVHFPAEWRALAMPQGPMATSGGCAPIPQGNMEPTATPYPAASYDTYFAFGHAGQFIYVVPELQLVTVITSSCQSSYTPRAYFTDYVLNAYMGA